MAAACVRVSDGGGGRGGGVVGWWRGGALEGSEGRVGRGLGIWGAGVGWGGGGCARGVQMGGGGGSVCWVFLYEFRIGFRYDFRMVFGTISVQDSVRFPYGILERPCAHFGGAAHFGMPVSVCISSYGFGVYFCVRFPYEKTRTISVQKMGCLSATDLRNSLCLYVFRT